MKAILLDDEPLSLRYLENLCKKIQGLEVAACFDNVPDALAYLSCHRVNLVLTDIEMPGFGGMDLAHCLRQTQPSLGVVFVTGYEEYALQAFQLDAIGYLMKPCTQEELSHVIHRANLLLTPVKKVTVRTFGHFSVFIHGVPIRFANQKAKELLALLVDRNGGVVTMEQAADLLWENRVYNEMVKRLYRKSVGYLHQVFKDTDFFHSDRGSCHIAPSAAECDYFALLRNPSEFASLYQGDYLLDYSWGEYTNGKLAQLSLHSQTPHS